MFSLSKPYISYGFVIDMLSHDFIKCLLLVSNNSHLLRFFLFEEKLREIPKMVLFKFLSQK